MHLSFLIWQSVCYNSTIISLSVTVFFLSFCFGSANVTDNSLYWTTGKTNLDEAKNADNFPPHQNWNARTDKTSELSHPNQPYFEKETMKQSFSSSTNFSSPSFDKPSASKTVNQHTDIMPTKLHIESNLQLQNGSYSFFMKGHSKVGDNCTKDDFHQDEASTLIDSTFPEVEIPNKSGNKEIQSSKDLSFTRSSSESFTLPNNFLNIKSSLINAKSLAANVDEAPSCDDEHSSPTFISLPLKMPEIKPQDQAARKGSDEAKRSSSTTSSCHSCDEVATPVTSTSLTLTPLEKFTKTNSETSALKLPTSREREYQVSLPNTKLFAINRAE